MSKLLAEIDFSDDDDEIDIKALKARHPLPPPTRGSGPSALPTSSAPSTSALPSTTTAPSTQPQTPSSALVLGSRSGLPASIGEAITTSAAVQSSALAIIQTPESTLTTKVFSAAELARPSAAETESVAQRTERALAVVMEKKAPPPMVAASSAPVRVVEIGGEHGVARTVAIVTAQRDPLDPRRHQIVKLRQSATSDVAPVIRSPTKRNPGDGAVVGASAPPPMKLPACVTSWSNSKGYIVPLAQREEADGRNHVRVVMSDRHAEVAAALREAEKVQAEESKKRRLEEALKQEAEQQAREKEVEAKALQALEAKRLARRAAVSGAGGESAEERNARRQRELDEREREKEELRKMRRTENAARRLGISADELENDAALQREVDEAVLDFDDTRLQNRARPAAGAADGEARLYDEALFGTGRRNTNSLLSGSVGGGGAAHSAADGFDISDLLK